MLGALAGLAAAAAGRAAAAPSTGEVRVGEVLPDAPLNGLNGRSRRLADYRGRPLIINVWASWCGPCRAEMASLERLAWHDVARQFAVIGISTDDYPDKAKAFLARSNATLSHFIDERLALEKMLGADRLPLTVLVDAKGKVLHKEVGAKAWDGPEALTLIGRAFGLKPVASGR